MGRAVEGVTLFPGSASVAAGGLGTLVFFAPSTDNSSSGGGEETAFQRLTFNDAQRQFPRGTLLRAFPVT